MNVHILFIFLQVRVSGVRLTDVAGLLPLRAAQARLQAAGENNLSTYLCFTMIVCIYSFIFSK